MNLPCRILAVFAVLAGLGACFGSAHAGEPVRILDSMSLSPDGSTLVLSWRGELWSVPSEGGAVKRLTTHPSTDRKPHFSPDGKEIAFISTRSGSSQIHVMPVEGGSPVQVTTHTEGHDLEGWFPDGESFLVNATRDHFWRRANRYFRQNRDATRKPEMLFNDYGRDGSLSPDGNRLLFTREGTRAWRKHYHGPQASQIWMLDRRTGKTTQITTHDHGERHPRWLGGSTAYLYTSQESGTFNLWRREADSSDAKQLTYYEDDGVHDVTVSADGSTVIFRRLFDLYRYEPGKTDLPKKIEVHYDGDPWMDPMMRSTLASATEAAFTDDAREIAFIAGGDVWVMDTELREPVQITNTPEEERSPVFSPDFESILFVSDAGGQCDIWKAERTDEDAYWWQQEEFLLRKLTNDPQPEESLAFTPDGDVTFRRLRGDVWMMDADGKDPRKLIESWNPVEFQFSPDGEWVVYSTQDDDFNRDIWIRPVDGSREPFNLSKHPDNEGNPTWSPDGKMIAFTGRRFDAETDLYYVHLEKESNEQTSRDRKLEKALEKMKGRKKGAGAKKEPKAKGKEKASKKDDSPKKKESPAAAGAGDPLTGSWEGTLSGPAPLPQEGIPFTLELTLGDEGKVTGTMGTADSPAEALRNGRFVDSTLSFVVSSPQGDANIEATVGKDAMEGNWSLSIGLSGTFQATREPTAVAAATASKEEKKSDGDKKGEEGAEEEEEEDKVKIDFDGLSDRIRRVSIPNSTVSTLLWSPDSKKLAFRTSVNGKRGMYTIEFPDKLTPKFMTSTVGSGGRWLEDGNRIVWLQGGRPATMSASGKAESYSFSIRHEVDAKARHLAAFDLAWRTMRDRWYDDRMGNNNWDAVRRKYREHAAECMTGAELTAVVSGMLGELNGSHLGFFATGGRPSTPRSSQGWRDTTVHLGARYDDAYQGPGIRVKDVVKGTPADRARSKLEAGDVILTIDGQSVDPSLELATVMTGSLDDSLELRVRGTDGEERTVDIRPTTFGSVRSRLYNTWIEANQAAVDEATGGKLGYLHIRGMNWPSFQKFEAELYKVGHGKDGLIIDVRENGGGFTTDHLLTCLTQPTHAITVPRGGGEGYPHDRMVYATWNKPIVVLCNQNSFSNAEIFSHAIKTLGRGQVVGVQTAGGVISTGGTQIMGVGFLRLPFRGWFLSEDGEDMELNGCMPHHVVWPAPGEIPNGVDRQLEKAVEVLLADVEAWKARPRPQLKLATERQVNGG